VVAVASPVATRAAARGRDPGWTIAAGGALLVGVLIRLALGSAAVGDRSATLMAVLLTLGAWVAARLVSNPRTAFFVALAMLALFDVAALPTRNPPAYDDLQAFYRTDQPLTVRLAVPSGLDQTTPIVSILAQPVFAGTQPAFGLAADVEGSSLTWQCAFQRGIQRLALPLPAGVLHGGSVDVRLHLTGSPSRESDYVLVYQSSKLGGFVISLEPSGSVERGATICSLA
jgi:hypothetical protein